MEYHTIYKRPEGETTQWEDLQIKFGNLPPKEPIKKADPFGPTEEETRDREWLEQAEDVDTLENLEDEYADDSYLEAYRQKRLQELKQAAKRPRFGTLATIKRDHFVAEVTEASRECWVVVHLYQEKVLGCQVIKHCLQQLATQYQYVKLINMQSTDCIPNYPDSNLPTLLVYRDGQCARTIVGLRTLGGNRISPESVAAGLNEVGPVCTEQNGAMS